MVYYNTRGRDGGPFTPRQETRMAKRGFILTVDELAASKRVRSKLEKKQAEEGLTPAEKDRLDAIHDHIMIWEWAEPQRQRRKVR